MNEVVIFKKRVFKLVLFTTIMFFSSYVNAEDSTSVANVDSLLDRQARLEKRLAIIEKIKSPVKGLEFSGYILFNYVAFGEEGKANIGDKPGMWKDSWQLRRARFTMNYKSKIFATKFTIEVNQKEVEVRDFYGELFDPRKIVTFRAGIFKAPVGRDVVWSSGQRELMERSHFNRALFPGERSVGATLTFSGPSDNFWKALKFSVGVMGGSDKGDASKNIDNFEPVVNLKFIHEFKEMVKVELGAYAYFPTSIQGTDSSFIFKKSEGGFVYDASLGLNSVLRKSYYGFDAALDIKSPIGVTTLRGEFIFGKQWGTFSRNTNDNFEKTSVLSSSGMRRSFNGYIATFAQKFLKTGHNIYFRYDHYDPNTKVKGSEIGVLAGTGLADVAYTTYSFGYFYDLNKYIRFTVQYDLIRNEITPNLEHYADDLKDDMLFTRVTFRF